MLGGIYCTRARWWWPFATGTPILQERTLRIFSAVAFIVQYVKLWGYHGMPLTFAWSTLSFGSWVLMELIYAPRSIHDPLNDQLPEGVTLTMAIKRTYLVEEFWFGSLLMAMQLVLVYYSINHEVRFGGPPQRILDRRALEISNPSCDRGRVRVDDSTVYVLWLLNSVFRSFSSEISSVVRFSNMGVRSDPTPPCSRALGSSSIQVGCGLWGVDLGLSLFRD